MGIEIGKKPQDYNDSQKAERFKKAVKIAVRSPYHCLLYTSDAADD